MERNQQTENEMYNGYPNYETWCVNLWLSNDPGTHEAAREIATDNEDAYDAEVALKEYVEEMIQMDEATMRSDLLGHALNRVNWRTLVENYRE